VRRLGASIGRSTRVASTKVVCDGLGDEQPSNVKAATA
jgi:hypothetical protein